MIVNRTGLADVTGLATTTIDKYVAEGMPFVRRAASRGGGWQFETADVVRWLIERRIGKHDETRDDAERRLAAVAATTRELELSQAQLVTVTATDVADIGTDIIATVRERIGLIPGSVAEAVSVESDPAGVEHILRRAITDAFIGLSGAETDSAVESSRQWPGACIAYLPNRDHLWATPPVARQALNHQRYCLCENGKCRGYEYVPDSITDDQLAEMERSAAEKTAEYLARRAAAKSGES